MLRSSAPARFPDTRWDLIQDVQRGAVPRQIALDELLARYWRPVYCYVRRKGMNADAAEDAVQGLFTQLLERQFLDRLDPERGSLRGFLKKATDHYLINQHARLTASKRGGAARTLSLDWQQAEQTLAAAPEDPTLAFDREWALAVMERAQGRLRAEYDGGRRRGNVDVVLGFFGLGQPRSYAEAATECGMSVAQFKAALHRARVRFRDLLAEEVGETVSGDGVGELRSLFDALS
jgi:RNA polymerase sigma-70 factor (ECF subfamily)